MSQVEYDRLRAAIRNGPARRMIQDQELGRPHAKDDIEQLERYERLMLAAKREN
jgi:hypothetical protein